MSRLALLLLLAPFQDSVPDLLERLKAPEVEVRRRAQEALALRGAEVLEPILKLLSEEGVSLEPSVREAAARLSSPVWKERARAEADLLALGRRALPWLDPLAASPDPELAWRSRAAAGEIRSRGGEESKQEDLQAAALCELLGGLGDARGLPHLLKILGSAVPPERLEVRLRAVEALARLRERMSPAQAEEAAERAAAVLDRCTGTPEKARLLRALGGLRAPGVIRPLTVLAHDKAEKNIHLRRSALIALASLGTGPALRGVARGLESEDPYLRHAASRLLEDKAGRAFGFDPLAGAEENRPALMKVQAWGRSLPGWE